MRTTVNIDDQLLVQAKRCAAARNLTLGEYVEEAVRHELLRESAKRTQISLPVFTRGTGMRAGIEASNRGLFDALDADGERA